MIKKVISAMLAAVGIVLSSQFIAFAAQVQIYDQSINNVLNSIKEDCSKYGFSIWGIEYYTYEGAKRCEFHF